MFLEPKRDRSEPRAPSKGKGKKHTFVSSSSSGRSSSSNLWYSDSSTSTQGFYPLKVFIHPNNFHIFNLHMVIHNHMFIIHHFLIMMCHISLKCILHHQC
ncbi:hypothetical protein Gotur_006837, partial [Gossypium turneri]